MKAEYIQEGKNLDYINPTNEIITAGTVVIAGEIAAVAAGNIAQGEVGAIATAGVWQMPKSPDAITMGAKVYYDKENDKVSLSSENSVFIGVAAADAAAADNFVNVRLGG